LALTRSGVYRTTVDLGCDPGPTTLCLNGGRFRVQVDWQVQPGRAGVGRSMPLTADTGGFWFFDRESVEVAVKVLDGRHLNGHFWVFYGSLSDVTFQLRVTDTATGVERIYDNPGGTFASRGDTRAFEGAGTGGATTGAEEAVEGAVLTGPVGSSELERRAAGVPVPLLGGRFRVEAAWTDDRGRTHRAQGNALADGSGSFWFFSPDNVELLVKAVNGRAINGHFWFFYASLSNVEFEITITDTQTDEARTYTNPAGTFASRGDAEAF
jgi:hypothetical protein